MTLSQAPPGGVATCSIQQSLTVTRGLQPPRQTGRLSSLPSRNMSITPTRKQGEKHTRRSRRTGRKNHGLSTVVTASTPYPLRPGTLPVGSGECFTCGLLGHMGRRDGSTCGGNRALHLHEQAWRSICSRILRQTRTVQNVQLVTLDDYGTQWQEVQGNEEGPSN